MISKGIAKYAIFILMTLSSAFCFAGTVNFATNATATASNIYKEHNPENAIDSNVTTGWNAGVAPFQWIEIDLGSRKEISEITALVDQSPPGDTIHNVFVDNVLSHTWNGFTSKGSLLSWTLPSTIKAQKIRIETTTSPSWVGWYEISIFGSDTPTPPSAEYKKNEASLAANFELSIPIIEYQFGQQHFFYSANLIFQGENAAGELLWKLNDYTPVASAPLDTVSAHLSDTPSIFFMKVDSIKQGQNNYWAQFQFIGNGSEFIWKLVDYGLN